MAISQAVRRRLKNRGRRIVRPQAATLVLVSVVGLSAAICAAWFAGEGLIPRLFEQLNTLQKVPPWWLQVPMMAGNYIFVPTVLLLIIALGVMWISPQPRGWARIVVVSVLLALTVRYILWRSISTLNLADPTNGVFSLGLFFLEMLMMGSSTIQLLLMLRVRDRQEEADQNAIAVISGQFTPSVDVFIPTYNEPEFVLRRTIIGCQAMDYDNKQIYLLDDTHRPEIRSLAAELGCEYMTRPDNRHAKAGNLNYAFAQTHSDLIVVFDADFIPTRNFLTRTIGFFQAEQVALVQTPQSFYNPDPIARNLGLENVLTSEEEVFYRQIQPIRDAAGSVICSGTSFVVRRTALEATGGFVTESLSEDYFTGIRLSAQGYQLVYLDEKLSAGLAADNMAAHATQRLRWARGTLQAFFIESNPLTIRGLTPLQRLAHLEGLLHWFTSLSRVGFLVMPLAYSFLSVIPVRATEEQLLYFFLPYYVVQLSVFSWLNYRSRSALLSDIYSLVLAVPLAWTVIQVMLNPFSRGFNVTPKGTSSDRYSYNWNLAIPLLAFFIITAISLWRNLGMCMIKGGWAAAPIDPIEALARSESIKGLGIGWLWSSYNLMMLSIALLILMDVPRPDPYDWFDLRRTVQITPHTSHLPHPTFWGVTTMVSEGGVEVALTQTGFPLLDSNEIPVTVNILEEALQLTGTAIRTDIQDEFVTVRIQFDAIPGTDHRRLVEMLFCRPGQWKRRNSPGEFRSLLLLLGIVLKPRILFDQGVDVRAIAVAKG
ncbi:glycosyltransferase [Phormidium sp. CLA17]|uniref:glycosyltransferase n=1 Tax=Leptolyngbya sp. Cla-17 TaxID=2803751 RepID=UPI00149252A6|nr:glycosyltransferase [Leptolyngbya sp. Cla-17]MBM0742894.1 glycosyltransferase [Leptolyngbya sp. Cla-17]